MASNVVLPVMCVNVHVFVWCARSYVDVYDRTHTPCIHEHKYAWQVKARPLDFSLLLHSIRGRGESRQEAPAGWNTDESTLAPSPR